MNEQHITDERKRGLEMGAGLSRIVLQEINSLPISDDCFEMFLLNLNAGLLGYASARLGAERTRGLLGTIQTTMEHGIASVTPGASIGVH
ncbi:hypothetical protein [Frateuria sp. YIM B11624]|uniref:hypothetical protein n=1 Tax=Frateuria sp. YIM B11624 TaxID=3143185 RepID=UPI003C733FC7